MPIHVRPHTALDQTARRGRCARALCVALAGLLSSCSPELDWRETRIGAAGLRASFPCRPGKQVRSLPLAGAPVTLTLLACRAAGVTFAISHADVGDPARVGPALLALRASVEANVAASSAAALGATPWQVPGMTPQPASGRWSLRGRLPDGAALRVETAVFSRGTQVVQATLLGPAEDPAGGKAQSDAALQPFFEGLRFAD